MKYTDFSLENTLFYASENKLKVGDFGSYLDFENKSFLKTMAKLLYGAAFKLAHNCKGTREVSGHRNDTFCNAECMKSYTGTPSNDEKVWQQKLDHTQVLLVMRMFEGSIDSFELNKIQLSLEENCEPLPHPPTLSQKTFKKL